MTMITPDRTGANAAANGVARITISHSASDCSEMLEEKKSVDAMDVLALAAFNNDDILSTGHKAMMLKKPEWRNIVSNEPGSKFLPEKGRYVLYVSRACPESHRALLVRTMKGLEDAIAVKYVHPQAGNNLQRNWIVDQDIPDDSMASFKSEEEGEFACVRDIYRKENDTISNSIPLLYDQEHHCIVNNQVDDIASMMNSAFNQVCKNPQVELYPQLPNQKELHEWLYPLLQSTPSNVPPYHYDLSPKELEHAFERATNILQKQRYLLSATTITEADLRLFVTLVRYDAVYAKFLERAPQLLQNRALLDYCRDIYQHEGVAATVRLDEIRAHFLGGRRMPSNGSNQQPEGLVELLEVPHKRDQFYM